MPNPQKFIDIACVGGVAADKKTQIAIAQEMQNWAAEEINERLEAYHLDLHADSKGCRYTGGWRSCSVDVHINTKELGLILAVDPKHLQSKESINKNWKNMLNDLVAFAGNIHSRFPMCVVGGVVGFEKSQTDAGMLDDMFSIVSKVAVRNAPTDQYALLEGFTIVVYDCNPRRLSPDIPPPTGNNSLFRASNVFNHMVDLLVQRHVR
jgi:hypothetical protein